MNEVSEPIIFKVVPPKLLGLRKCGLQRTEAHGWQSQRIVLVYHGR